VDWSSFSIGNAAGFVKGPGLEFDDLLRSAVTDITVGSLTLAQRDGNPGIVYYLEEDGTSINSLGLPNPGADATEDTIEVMANQARRADKRLRISIAGFSVEEYVELAERLGPYGHIEVNLGCPNVWGGGGQKPIASFDLHLMGAILSKVAGFTNDGFDVKVSPYSDPGMIPQVANTFLKYPVRHVVSCNTFPNGLAIKDGKRAIDIEYGGVAGNALHLIALGQVAQFAKALADSDTKVIGVGGIDSGTRLLAMRVAGASGAQIGTAFGERKAKVFSEVLEEVVPLAA